MITQLKQLKDNSFIPWSQGLSNKTIEQFLRVDKRLALAIEQGALEYKKKEHFFKSFNEDKEEALAKIMQENILNFYSPLSISPYIPLSAKGPWIVTLAGSVIYDVGGYGMLGFGHNPDFILDAISKPYVMANVMTPSDYQYKISLELKKQIGIKKGKCPYEKFIFLNSGSEAMELAGRIADVKAKNKLNNNPSLKFAFASLKNSFHGRTFNPARVSDSSRKSYLEHLASFQDIINYTININDLNGLQDVFNKAKDNNHYIAALFLEPVQGEGNPGVQISVEFYKLARELTKANDSLLIIDSIQAGLRCQGYLSVMDYCGFEDLPPPNIESYSKAVNGGQFPLSVLALMKDTAKLYRLGLYGNTMTTNPRGLAVALSLFNHITPEVRENIRQKGEYLLSGFANLHKKYPDIIVKTQGTGLLLAIEINSKYPVVAENGLEMSLRKKGLNVIHGGDSFLRFTPSFNISKEEADLIITILDELFSTL